MTYILMNALQELPRETLQDALQRSFYLSSRKRMGVNVSGVNNLVGRYAGLGLIDFQEKENKATEAKSPKEIFYAYQRSELESGKIALADIVSVEDLFKQYEPFLDELTLEEKYLVLAKLNDGFARAFNMKVHRHSIKSTKLRLKLLSDVDACDDTTLMNLLVWAVSSGLVATVKRLLTKYRLPDEHHCILLYNAAESGSVAVVECLLTEPYYRDNPANISADLAKERHEFLRRAVANGHLALVNYLLALPFYQEQATIRAALVEPHLYNYTPALPLLGDAAGSGCVAVFDRVLSLYYQANPRDTNLNAVFAVSRHYVLYRAINSGSMTMVERVLNFPFYRENPENLNNALLIRGQSMLSRAAARGDLTMVNFLLAQPFYCENPGNLAAVLAHDRYVCLNEAAANGHVDVLNRLLLLPFFRDNQKHVEEAVFDHGQHNALCDALEKGRLLVVKRLLKLPCYKGFILGYWQDSKLTLRFHDAIIQAAYRGDVAMVRYLLSVPCCRPEYLYNRFLELRMALEKNDKGVLEATGAILACCDINTRAQLLDRVGLTSLPYMIKKQVIRFMHEEIKLSYAAKAGAEVVEPIAVVRNNRVYARREQFMMPSQPAKDDSLQVLPRREYKGHLRYL